jgi:hypothetical protein
MHGPSGIVPTRGQVIALRANAPLSQLGKSSWDGNEGFEYWFPRPPSNKSAESSEHPLVIIGGGREVSGAFEYYQIDDSKTNELVGKALRNFLPGVFPGKYEKGREPEMEWVRYSLYFLCLCQSSLSGRRGLWATPRLKIPSYVYFTFKVLSMG